MKKLFFTGIMMILAGVMWIYKVEIHSFVFDVINKVMYNNNAITSNDYYRKQNFNFLQITDDFEPNTKNDLMNIFYTVINSGMEKFEFFCPSKYKDCINDVLAITNDEALLSHVSNFVHPYNNFERISVKYTNTNRVTIKVEKVYETGDIAMINVEVDKLLNKLVSGVDDDLKKVRILHDYIINNTKYDSDRSDFNIINYKSDIAYGPLFQGYGICGGYSDTMALFLDRLDIKNYKISTDKHVWNAVYINNAWYHLDLTWDDPVTSDNTDLLGDSFFLITTDQLKKVDAENHAFDENIYSELKEA